MRLRSGGELLLGVGVSGNHCSFSCCVSACMFSQATRARDDDSEQQLAADKSASERRASWPSVAKVASSAEIHSGANSESVVGCSDARRETFLRVRRSLRA